MLNPPRTARSLLAVVSALLLLVSTAAPVSAVGIVDPGADGDDRVTGQTWVRHDDGTDQAIDHCNDASTSDEPDAVPDDGDSDSNDGGSRRQANEPYSVIDPTDPQTVIAGWNDYCQTDLGAGWEGFAYSRDGGETWTNSFVPGYPADTSTEGTASVLFGRHTEAGDPIAAFDNDGNLFVGGISFNRAGAINGDVFVATYTADDVPISNAPDYPVDYSHTNVVGQGTPSRNFFGIFQDKPLLEVDRTGGDTDGNVYVCWSRFTGFGHNKIQFSRSTDSGQTFSKPIFLSAHGKTGSVQGCDIAIEGDGDVYVTFRTFADRSQRGQSSLYFARSTDGGASFSEAQKIRDIVPYAPADPFRDCGDGAFECTSSFVYARVPLEPRSTADQNGTENGVHLVYNEIETVMPSDPAVAGTYRSAGFGRVGRSVVYVVSSTDDGATWSDRVKVDDAGGLGHQFFPDIDALKGTLAVVWQDSRTDPCYSVQLPMGNTAQATSCGTDIVNTFVASSVDGGATWSASVQVSDVAHQPQYEMFGDRNIPFQGDYNWISIVDTGAGLEAYATWTDNRDVVEGEDPREGEDQDGFDVLQCRVFNEETERWGPDLCANAGGLDQEIFGNRVSLP